MWKTSWHARFQTLVQHETQRTWVESRIVSEWRGWRDCLVTLSTIPPKPRPPDREQENPLLSFTHTPSPPELFCVALSACGSAQVGHVFVYVPVGCAACWVGPAEPGVCVKRLNSPSAQCFLDTHFPNAPPAPVPSGWDAAPKGHTSLLIWISSACKELKTFGRVTIKPVL